MAEDKMTGVESFLGLLDGAFSKAGKQAVSSAIEATLTTPEGREAARQIVTQGIQTLRTAADEISRNAQIVLLETRLKTLKRTP